VLEKAGFQLTGTDDGEAVYELTAAGAGNGRRGR
jgi:hypothetical protein